LTWIKNKAQRLLPAGHGAQMQASRAIIDMERLLSAGHPARMTFGMEAPVPSSP
jgi:hypothetical protein